MNTVNPAEPPEQALAPIPDAAEQLAGRDQQQREADAGDDIGERGEDGALEAVGRRPAVFAMLMRAGLRRGGVAVIVRGRRASRRSRP